MSEFTANITGCLPCCGSVANYVAFDCRNRGGTASLIGCAEYGFTPSVPPRYYRLVTASGGATTKQYSDSGCTVETGSVSCVYTGWLQYNANTAATTSGGSTVCNGSTVGTGNGCGNGTDKCETHWAYTTTTASRTSTGACCSLGGGVWDKTTSDSLVDTLSDEDLETDAISRLIAVSNYSAWTHTGDGSGGTCIPSTCCKSNYQSRSTANFTYVESQYRANVQAANSTGYTLSAELWRAPSSFSNYALYATQSTGFTTNSTGFASTVVNVPVTKGWATYAANVSYS